MQSDSVILNSQVIRPPLQSNYIVSLSIATERAMTLFQRSALRRHCYKAYYIRFRKALLQSVLHSFTGDMQLSHRREANRKKSMSYGWV